MARLISVALIVITGASCDVFHGPVFRNEFSSVIEVTIKYDDGTESTRTWVACQTRDVGATVVGRWGMSPSESKISAVDVRADGKLIYHLGEKEIAGVQRDEEAGKIWLLTPEGIKASKNKNCTGQ